jgi:hypothetical protein
VGGLNKIVINVTPYLKNNQSKGWVVWLKCRVPALQVKGPEFKPQNPKKIISLTMLSYDYLICIYTMCLCGLGASHQGQHKPGAQKHLWCRMNEYENENSRRLCQRLPRKYRLLRAGVNSNSQPVFFSSPLLRQL